MTYHRPEGVPFEKNVNQWGGISITIPGDTNRYYIEKDQRWLPHVVSDSLHPAAVGDMVTVDSKYMIDQIGGSVVYVSGVRSLKISQRRAPIKQVEILGRPCQWYAIGHFTEYREIEKYRAMGVAEVIAMIRPSLVHTY